MSLEDEVKALYRENPNISGEEIRQRLGRPNTRRFWQALERIQVGMRGVYPAKRKNRNKPISFAKGFRKGPVYFIPPEEKL